MKTIKFQCSVILLLLTTVLFTACHKELQTQNEGVLQEDISGKVLTWLDSKKKGSVSPVALGETVKLNAVRKGYSNVNRNANIELLKANLDFSSSTKHSQDNNFDLLVVPIKEELKTKKKLDNTSSLHLLLTCDKAGNIIIGKIVQFFPKDKRKHEFRNEVVANIQSSRPVTEDGEFKFMNVAGRLISKCVYEGGKRTAVGIVQKKTNNRSLNLVDVGQQVCYTYTMTWYYNIGGYSFSETEILSSYCEPCDQSPYGYLCDDDEGGGEEELLGRYQLIIMNDKPGIPGNDSTVVQGSVYAEGWSGLFSYIEWYGSAMYKKAPGYTYTEQDHQADIYNGSQTPGPHITTGWLGAVFPVSNTSYNVGYYRQYTYTQAFP
jgi:hypothetical protein